MTKVMPVGFLRPPFWPAGPQSDNGNMICVHCRVRHHEDCPGGTWCDCQHLPPAGSDDSAQDAEQAGEHAAEPTVNWIRQG